MKVSELLYIHEQQGLETAISEVLKICDSSTQQITAPSETR
jgi:hypothetical protein